MSKLEIKNATFLKQIFQKNISPLPRVSYSLPILRNLKKVKARIYIIADYLQKWSNSVRRLTGRQNRQPFFSRFGPYGVNLQKKNSGKIFIQKNFKIFEIYRDDMIVSFLSVRGLKCSRDKYRNFSNFFFL